MTVKKEVGIKIFEREREKEYIFRGLSQLSNEDAVNLVIRGNRASF
jgi:hypothetical protein